MQIISRDGIHKSQFYESLRLLAAGTVMDFSQILAPEYNISRFWISFPKLRGLGMGLDYHFTFVYIKGTQA
jgi:hypothetical protein